MTSFTDDMHVTFDGDPVPPPAILWQLLDRLGVVDASNEDQAAAVRAWLAKNEPTSTLRQSIDRSGLLATLV